MHIINAFIRFWITGYRKLQTFVNNRRYGYTTPRDDELRRGTSSSTSPSLTSEYEDFSHSAKAVQLCLLHVCIYYTAAVIAFSFVIENWTIIDSLYFASSVFTTIGFGDLHPSNHTGRVFTIILSFYGVVMLGIFLGIAGEALIEGHNKALQRKEEKVSRSVIKSLAREQQSSHSWATDDSVGENMREKGFFQEVWSIVYLEAPIVAIVVILALIIGYVEGWSIIGR